MPPRLYTEFTEWLRRLLGLPPPPAWIIVRKRTQRSVARRLHSRSPDAHRFCIAVPKHRRVARDGRIVRGFTGSSGSSGSHRRDAILRYLERHQAYNDHRKRIQESERAIEQLQHNICFKSRVESNGQPSARNHKSNEEETEEAGEEEESMETKLKELNSELEAEYDNQRAVDHALEDAERKLLSTLQLPPDEDSVAEAQDNAQSKVALRELLEARGQIKRLQSKLRKEESALHGAKENELKALQQAGVLHISDHTKQLKLQVDSTQLAIRNLQSRQNNARSATYWSLPSDLTKSHELFSPYAPEETVVADIDKVYRSITEDYAQAHLRVSQRRKDHDEYQAYYNIKLREHLEALDDTAASHVDLMESDARIAFDVDWFTKWTEMIKKFDRTEDVFVQRRNLALEQGYTERPLYDHEVGSDLPAFAGTCPHDGHAESNAPIFVEERKVDFNEKRPWIQRWINACEGDGLQRERNSTISSACPESQDPILPWDSMSSKNTRPRQRARIDTYNRRWNPLG